MSLSKKGKWAAAILFMCLLVFLCGGCQNDAKLSDKFDEEMVRKEAKEVIQLVNDEDYETLADQKWDAAMQMQLSAEQMKTTVKPLVDELGVFDSFANESVTGSKDKDTDQEYASAVIIAAYEKRKAQYTIFFNTDMKVSGFFIK